MSFKTIVSATLILLTACLPLWARKNPARQFVLRNDVTINGAEVPAGNYELTWDVQSATARVTLWKDGEFVATARGA